MDDRDFMNAALRLAALAAAEGEVPVGAVVTLGGEIVGRGRNRREKSKNALAHAEIEAINDACSNLGGWRLWQCDMFVTLEPCPMCAGAIINSRIKRVVFGAYDHKPQLEGGFMQEECSAILSGFFKQLRDGKK